MIARLQALSETPGKAIFDWGDDRAYVLPRPPATDEVICESEERMQFTLNDQLRALYRFCDGVEIFAQHYEINDPGYAIAAIWPIAGIAEENLHGTREFPGVPGDPGAYGMPCRTPEPGAPGYVRIGWSYQGDVSILVHPTEYSVHVAGRKYPKGSDHSDLYRIRKIADSEEEWLKRLLEERTDYWELD